MVFESLLNYSFYAVRMTRSDDGQGGWSIGYVDIDRIDGRLRPASAREREIASQEQRVITHVFYCDSSANIARGDYISPGEITINGSIIQSDDIIVKVEGVREPSTAGAHYEIDCIEYQFDISEALIS